LVREEDLPNVARKGLYEERGEVMEGPACQKGRGEVQTWEKEKTRLMRKKRKREPLESIQRGSLAVSGRRKSGNERDIV